MFNFGVNCPSKSICRRGNMHQAFLAPLRCFCLRRCDSISCLKSSMPSWPCEASFMALDCMHILYWSGGSSSTQRFSCHRWKRPRDGARTTSRLLWRYFLYRWTSSPPQPLMSTSKPPVRGGDSQNVCNDCEHYSMSFHGSTQAVQRRSSSI